MTKYILFVENYNAENRMELTKVGEIEAPNPKKARMKMADEVGAEVAPMGTDGEMVRLHSVPKTHHDSGAYEIEGDKLI